LPNVPAISIVDDDALVRAATANLVRSLGYTVHMFASAEEFLLSPHLNSASCVVADVQMPTMSGTDLQNHLQTQGNQVPFIFITAFPEERVRAHVLGAGAIGYLTKPFDGDSLVQCLQIAVKEA
jgi:FixJ family two-component response regulator